jgi:hypothetical protein
MIDGSYDGDLSDSKDWIRFTLQDTDLEDLLLSDMEINSVLTLNNDDKHRAAAKLAKGLASKFSLLANKKIGPLTIDYTSTVKFYLDLAESLLAEVSTAETAPDEEMSDYDNIFSTDTHA